MFENLSRFSHAARRALALAQDEARALGRDAIDTEHLLLALVRNPTSASARVLERLSIAPQMLRESILADTGPVTTPAEHQGSFENLPVTPRVKKVLSSALQESLRAGERSVTTTGLLLALAEDRSSLVSRTLTDLGANPQRIREQVVALRPDADQRSRPATFELGADRQGASNNGAVAKPPAQTTDRGAGPEPDAKVVVPIGQSSEAGPTRRRAQRVIRAVQLVLALQLLVFSLLALSGWGALPSRDVDPPRMEHIGAPPGLIDTYASLSHITYPLEDTASREIATAAYVGTPANWGGPEPVPPSLNVLGQSIGTTLHQLSPGSANTIMFVVPSSALQRGPLYVVIQGSRYRLSLATDESASGFAVVTAAVNNHLLSAFDSSLLWLTLPAPGSTVAPLVLIRRSPAAQAYTLTHGTLGETSRTGAIASSVSGVTLGTPVVAITASTSALAGFLETAGSGPSSFVSTSVVANVLSAVGPSVSGGS